MVLGVVRSILCICLLITLIGGQCFGQVVAIQNDRNNTAFVGIGNTLTVAVEDHKASLVQLQTDNGEIKIDSYRTPGHFVFWPKKVGLATIYVGVADKKGRVKVIDSVYFTAKRFPPPELSLAGKKGGEISQSLLLVQIAPSARLSYALTGMCGDFTITNFTIEVLRNGRTIYERSMANSKGTRIDSVSNDFFHQLKNNDKLIFKNVIAVGAGRFSYNLEPIEFKITDAHKYRKQVWDDTVTVIDPITGQEIQKWIHYKYKRADRN